MVVRLVVVMALALPTRLSRVVFWTILGQEVHDGYSIVIGFYLLWGSYFFGKTLVRIKSNVNGAIAMNPGVACVYLFKHIQVILRIDGGCYPDSGRSSCRVVPSSFALPDHQPRAYTQDSNC